MDRRDIVERLRSAHSRLLQGYAEWGGHNFHGWTVQEDTRNFLGSTIWTEADCVFRYALELEKDFPGQLHFELSLDKATRLDYDPVSDRRQAVDIVISDLADFPEDETSMERFRSMTHTAFVEAKWLKKGWWDEAWQRDAFKRVDSVISDAARLQQNIEMKRCQVGAVLVFDDECFFEFHGGEAEWPNDVLLLLVSPYELKRRGWDGASITASISRAERLGATGKGVSRLALPS